MTDSQSIKGERGTFSLDAARSWTLPSRYYVDAEIYALEQRRIFQRVWHYVGHQSDLPKVGSYLTETIAEQPILVVRGRDRQLRAFYNVCQHRGHLLLKGTGQLSAGITCPYHAWTYGLDGCLVAAHLTDDVAGFNKADFPLRSLPLSDVAGLLFVNLDPAALALAVQMPGLEKTFLDHLPGLRDFTAAYRLSFDIAANWKVCVDNFSEAYHIPVAHPELSTLHGGQPKAAVTGELFAFYQNRPRTTYSGFQVTPEDTYVSWVLWPHHCLLSLPGSAHLIMLRMSPAGPARCLERVDVLAPPGAPPANLEKVTKLFAEVFNPEDIAIVESVQRGLSSLGYDQGRYIVDSKDSWFSESGLHKFHRLILQALQS